MKTAHSFADCMPFEGEAGQIIGALLGGLALLSYVLVWLRSPTDRRTKKVFSLDLAKIAISQSMAWLVNLGWAHLDAAIGTSTDPNPGVPGELGAHGLPNHTAGTSAQLQGIGWYGAILVVDAFVGVPLGIMLVRGFGARCQAAVTLRRIKRHEIRGRSPSRERSSGKWYGAMDDDSNVAAKAEGGQAVKLRRPGSAVNAVSSASFGSARQASLLGPSASLLALDDSVTETDEDELSKKAPDATPPPHHHHHHHHHRSCWGRFMEMNAETGRYWPDREEVMAAIALGKSTSFVDLEELGMDGPGDVYEPVPRWSWWAAQVFTWSVCVLVSRIFSGAVMLTADSVLGPNSPPTLLAGWLSHLQLSCPQKQLAIAGGLRLILDVMQIALIDLYNHFERRLIVLTAA